VSRICPAVIVAMTSRDKEFTAFRNPDNWIDLRCNPKVLMIRDSVKVSNGRCG
jgi:hypothetical protein